MLCRTNLLAASKNAFSSGEDALNETLRVPASLLVCPSLCRTLGENVGEIPEAEAEAEVDGISAKSTLALE